MSPRIGQKLAVPTAREEREAYQIATQRDHDTCQRCLRNCGQGTTSRHHRKGRGVGGRTDVVNLVVLGGTGTTGCHGWVTANPVLAVAEGWAVPGWADPAQWPAARWLPTAHGTVRAGWVLFTTDGLWAEIGGDEKERRMH